MFIYTKQAKYPWIYNVNQKILIALPKTKQKIGEKIIFF